MQENLQKHGGYENACVRKQFLTETTTFQIRS